MGAGYSLPDWLAGSLDLGLLRLPGSLLAVGLLRIGGSLAAMGLLRLWLAPNGWVYSWAAGFAGLLRIVAL